MLTKIGRVTFWVKFSLIAILIFIAIHALAYGTGFVAGPEAGLEEFGYDTSEAIDDGARILIGIVGIAFIGAAAFSVLAAWRTIKGDQSGLAVTIVLGGIYLGMGIYASFFERLWFDVFFFGISGFAIILLAGMLWKSLAPASIPNQPIDQAPDQ
ncbi:MAG: hypothetical protein ACE5Q6_06770 [Dehalococcoidia bacterium]